MQGTRLTQWSNWIEQSEGDLQTGILVVPELHATVRMELLKLLLQPVLHSEASFVNAESNESLRVLMT